RRRSLEGVPGEAGTRYLTVQISLVRPRPAPGRHLQCHPLCKAPVVPIILNFSVADCQRHKWTPRWGLCSDHERDDALDDQAPAVWFGQLRRSSLELAKKRVDANEAGFGQIAGGMQTGDRQVRLSSMVALAPNR